MKTLEDLPSKLDDIVHFSLNIDSLIQIIQYLNKNNTEMGLTIKDLTRRISSIENMNDDLAQLTIKTQAHDKRFYEVEDSISNHAMKLLEIGQANASFDKAVQAHEENLNNLNRVVEDHLKSAKAQEEKVTSLQQNLIETTLKIDKSIADMKTSKQEEAKMKEAINSLSSGLNSLKDTIELKFIDMDKTISNVISLVSQQPPQEMEGGATPSQFSKRRSGVPMLPIPSSSGSASDYLVKLALDDIEKLNKNAEETVRNHSQMKMLIQNYNEINEAKRNEINKKIDRIMNILSNSQNSNQETQMNADDNNEGNNLNANECNITTTKLSLKYEEEHQKMMELYQQLSDNISIIGTSLGDKVTRDELNNINHVTLGKIEILSDKINESIKGVENRMKKMTASGGGDGGSSQMADLEFFTQSIEKQMMENINKISIENIKKFLSDGDLSSNPTLMRIISQSNKHTEELNEAFKSIVDIRSILVSNDILEDINDIKTRLDLNEEDNRRLKFKFEEFRTSLEEEEQPEVSKPSPSINQMQRQSISNASSNVKSSIISLTAAYKDVNDKLISLEKRHKEMTTEIRESIKNSLKSETEKVIEQFQKNLTSFTHKFEYQLKNKIDQIGLSSFEYKMNNRLTNEMRNKLDQKDMKKNNNAINRKLDSLENKISKTLVDTIIDLQMDEAPLIVKTNNKNIEKCASCNQSLPQTTYLLTSDNQTTSASVNKMRTSKMNFNAKDKDKLPDINEAANKSQG